jgi:uncharacterized membrane protein YdbT with pleckstrin-like domain
MVNKKHPQYKTSSLGSDQPVSYDAYNRPLYSHPSEQPREVHISRPLEPTKPVISQSIQHKHERSKELYPNLNLSEGEYVIREVKRHPIGLVIPLAIGTFLLAFSVFTLTNHRSLIDSFNITGQLANLSVVMWPLLLFMLLVTIGMYVVYYVYVNNRFFLTNESVIQENRLSLFSQHEQTVSLTNIEDTSFRQYGILQQIFNYGSIRLSTEGDETTYRFSYVANPKEYVAVLNNAVEAFQNGRPIDDN